MKREGKGAEKEKRNLNFEEMKRLHSEFYFPLSITCPLELNEVSFIRRGECLITDAKMQRCSLNKRMQIDVGQKVKSAVAQTVQN